MSRCSPPSRLTVLLAPLALAACGQATSTPTATGQPMRPAAGATVAHPVVVELFQSQGCSSCPPANANVNALAARPDVLALSFAVTYWDQLGWKDRFAAPAYTARQWEYARHAGRPQVATPQVVINGGATVVGSNRAQLDAALERAGPVKGGPAIVSGGATVRLAAGTGAPSTVWLVRYDPMVREVAIRAGENGGRTLPHRNIVRELAKLGEWRGAAVAFAVPAPREPALVTAVLVQTGVGGPITAARRL